MGQKPIVFISYSRKDEKQISPYLSALEQNYSLWIDRTGIESSEQFKEKIVSAIKKCDYFVFFSSKASNESGWTAKEIGIAVSEKKVIIPIKLDSSPYNSSVAFDLVNINFCDDSEEQHIYSLLTSLELLQRARRKKKREVLFCGLALSCILFLTILFAVFSHRPSTIGQGQILDEYGAVLAHSVLKDTTSLIINCTVGTESKWDREAKDFSGDLAQLCPELNAYQYYSRLKDGRANSSKNLILVEKIPLDTYNKVKCLPFFSGVKVRRLVNAEIDNFKRVYPRGGLAKRTIGHLLPGDTMGEFTPGLEGSYYRELKKFDLRTTLNIDFQEVSEKIVQKVFKETINLESACLAIMDIHTGAIKTIVNLERQDISDLPREYQNLYIGVAYEPGSLFLPISYAVLMENTNLDVNDSLSIALVNSTLRECSHFTIDPSLLKLRFEDNICIRDGLRISSPGVCRYLVYNHYSEDCNEFYHSLEKFELMSPPAFDLKGMKETNYIAPNDDKWTDSDLLSNCCGWDIEIPPIMLHSFYNTIANDGIYVKPYLVESLEKDGKIRKNLNTNFGKRILSSNTSSKLNDALIDVVARGTASRQFKDSKTLVAGKTGTGFIEYGQRANDSHRKFQGSFIGYFPADKPVFSIFVLCKSFAEESPRPIYGGVLPAMIANEVVDTLCNMNTNLIYR